VHCRAGGRKGTREIERERESERERLREEAEGGKGRQRRGQASKVRGGGHGVLHGQRSGMGRYTKGQIKGEAERK
jgi:tryptophan synthase beta subunit